jgi:hypothetical protein
MKVKQSTKFLQAIVLFAIALFLSIFLNFEFKIWLRLFFVLLGIIF